MHYEKLIECQRCITKKSKSSGKRIVDPADDAGGMSVAYKMNSKLKRTEAVRQNIQNGISYLQVQDGAMTTIAKVLDRMSSYGSWQEM